MRKHWPTFLLCAAVAASVLAVYLQTSCHEFVNLDAPVYIVENEHVREGATLEGAVWAFTTFTAANWHPATWLSLMADCELFGLDSGAHHLAAASLHAVNACLLLLLLNSATGALWPSALAAALLALIRSTSNQSPGPRSARTC